MIGSIVIAAVPYSIYLVFGGSAFATASIKGTPAYGARMLVNNLVAVFIGGPHMYATFTRTILDRDFLRKRILRTDQWVLVQEHSVEQPEHNPRAFRTFFAHATHLRGSASRQLVRRSSRERQGMMFKT